MRYLANYNAITVGLLSAVVWPDSWRGIAFIVAWAIGHSIIRRANTKVIHVRADRP